MSGPDLESYSILPSSERPKSPLRSIKIAAAATIFISLAAAVVLLSLSGETITGEFSAASRGTPEGVSEKSIRGRLRSVKSFPWSNQALQWQRTAFHFQPTGNWMNDPNAPVYYNGWYHLFYQYNPRAAVWGNISWGHAASHDLVNWLHLPLAMVPDRWYDSGGVWSGSATILPGENDRIAVLYTGSTNASVQVQNLAVPSDPEGDHLLRHWSKADAANPVLVPPPGVGDRDFRDPTTAWFEPHDSSWRFAIGSKDDDGGRHEGVAYLYRTTADFSSFERLPGRLHSVPGTGMWECVDFYPVSSETETTTKHVLKASMDDDRHDYYAIGRYSPEEGRWYPDDMAADVGLGLRYDYGQTYYASKSFYDPSKGRRVLWAWISESDTEQADVLKGWASLQGIPRTVSLDPRTDGANLLQWPVEEVEALRTTSDHFADVDLPAGSVVPIQISGASTTQLDIEAEFAISASAADDDRESTIYNCSGGGGAGARGAYGPFGVLVLADTELSVQTAVYFYLARKAGDDGGLETHFCHDETRSSKADDIVKRVVGSTVPAVATRGGEVVVSVRILVDHSIVESFAEGGRTCITSRVYPTEVGFGSGGVFLFNNATAAGVTARSVKVWQMAGADIRTYTDDTTESF